MKKSTYIALLFLAFLVSGVTGGTWTTNQFGYKPSLGARGAPEKNGFDAGLDRIDTRLGKEIWVGDPAYGATLQAAIAAISSNHAILRVPPGTHNIAADLLIPANISLKIERGAILSIVTSKTLTINGSLEASRYQIFSCAGTGAVVFGSPLTLYPEWWGCAGNGVTDDFTPMKACLAAIPAGGVCDIGAKSFAIGTKSLKLPFRSGYTLRGVSPNVSKFVYTYANANNNSDGMNLYSGGGGGTFNNITIENICFTGSSVATGPTNLLNFSENTEHLTIKNCEFSYPGPDATSVGGVNGLVLSTYYTQNNTTVRDCYFHHIGTTGGVHCAEGMTGAQGAGLTVDNCVFENIGSSTIIGSGCDLDLTLGGTDIKIINNRFNGKYSGLTFYSSTTPAITRVAITGNIFNGVLAINLQGIINGDFSGNTLYGSSLNIGNNDGLTIASNIIYGNYTATAVMAFFGNTSSITNIIGNTFLKTATAAYLYNCYNVLFKGNYCDAASGAYTALIYTTGNNNRFIDNYFQSVNNYCLRFDAVGTGTVVAGNKFNTVGGQYGIKNNGATATAISCLNNKQVGAGYANPYGVTNLPLYGSTTLSGGTKAITFPGELTDAIYQVTVTGGANETFYVTDKAVTGFTIHSSNGSSSASVDYVVNRN